MSDKCRFNVKWLRQPLYQDWLQEAASKHEAYCKYCSKTFAIGSMGASALRSHLRSGKHQELARTMVANTLDGYVANIVPPTSESTVTVPSSAIIPQSSECSTPSSQGIQEQMQRSSTSCRSKLTSGFLDCQFKDSITRAEILWCLHSVNCNHSLSSAGIAVDILRLMFPNEPIATHMSLARTKVGYTIVHGIAPFLEEHLRGEVCQSQCFSISFDEALNSISQRGQMDLYVRFWLANKVVARYFSSSFLGHATAVNLHDALQNAVGRLNTDNMIQIGMDGPNVNIATLKLVNESRKQKEQPKLLDIGTCSLHVLDGALRAADAAAGMKLMTFLRSIWLLFKDVPARRADYIYYSQTECPPMPLKYCTTRWVENVPCAERAIAIIPYLKSYIAGVISCNKEPTSFSYETVKDLLRDPCLEARLAFFISAAKPLESFLTAYQSDAPMVPFIFSDIEALVTLFMRRFLKPSVLAANETAEKKMKLPLKDENLLPYDQVDIGFGAKLAIKAARKNGATDLQARKFMADCRTFLVAVVRKILLRSPLKYQFVKGCSCLNPAVVLNNNKNVEYLSIALEALVFHQQLSPEEADIVKSNYQSLTCSDTAVDTLNSYKRSDRLDDLWIALCTNESYPLLEKFVRIILCLSHGQAAVERGFSLNKKFIVENQLEASLIAQRRIKDYLAAKCDSDLKNVIITKQMINSVRCASGRYKFALKEADRKSSEKEKEEHENKRKAAEISEKESERKRLRLQLQQVNAELQELKK